MKKINCLFVSLILLLSSVSSALAQPALQLAKSKQRYVYDVSYKKIPVGQIIRELQHNGEAITAKTTADLSFLFYHFGGSQRSDLYWDDSSQSFLSKRFVRKSVGFLSEKMQADFLKSGHQTKVIRDGKTYQFVNEKAKIVDFNAIAMQISDGLKSGQTHFEFYMQTSDSIGHYFFEVAGKEVISTRFGKLDTYRLQQTHKKNRTLIVWLAPQINYQMVKFHYKFKLLDLNGILTNHSSANL